jgi:cytochrome bd ubiquinol oxidase subunit I
VRFGLEVPGLLSFLVYGRSDAPVAGLDEVPPSDRPPVAVPFQSFHAMVALGVGFIGLTLLALFFLWRGTLFSKRWLLWIFVFAVLGAYAANQLGWVAAEVGRQPWIVYGLLRTGDAASKAVAPGEVRASIVMFSVIYLMLFAVWVYVMNDKIAHGPEEAEAMPEKTTREGLLEAAARRASPAGHSLTGARRRPRRAGRGEE